MSDREAFLWTVTWCVLFVALLAVTVVAGFRYGGPRKPAAPVWYVEVCSGCQTEWRSQYPQKPIDKCPNCPMSEEEWEALKESVRKRRDGIGS